MSELPDTDFTQRFIFDDSDVRGELVSLERSYAEVLAKHPYPEPVAQLLGEFMAAAALLVGTLKFDGLLILQARSSGPEATSTTWMSRSAGRWSRRSAPPSCSASTSRRRG